MRLIFSPAGSVFLAPIGGAAGRRVSASRPHDAAGCGHPGALARRSGRTLDTHAVDALAPRGVARDAIDDPLDHGAGDGRARRSRCRVGAFVGQAFQPGSYDASVRLESLTYECWPCLTLVAVTALAVEWRLFQRRWTC